MKTVDRFADALKRKLRRIPPNDLARDNGGMGSTETGWMPDIEIDWDVLDKQIDALCAEFAANPMRPG
jgi:hypothetical protein